MKVSRFAGILTKCALLIGAVGALTWALYETHARTRFEPVPDAERWLIAGQYERAAEAYEHLIADRPDDPDVLLNYARALSRVRVQTRQQALRHLEQIE